MWPAGRSFGSPMDAPAGYWVFGYGSLMWDPGFDHLEAHPALMRGYHRAFCIYSRHYRGTPAHPGLVLGLAPGGSCRGMAFRIANPKWPQVRDYLHAREMTAYIYRPRTISVRTRGLTVPAHTYVADHQHPNYAGGLAATKIARIIARAVGERGSNRDYLEQTVRHLADIGVKDNGLRQLQALVRQLDGGG